MICQQANNLPLPKVYYINTKGIRKLIKLLLAIILLLAFYTYRKWKRSGELPLYYMQLIDGNYSFKNGKGKTISV
jgi:hypothetical protein